MFIVAHDLEKPVLPRDEVIQAPVARHTTGTVYRLVSPPVSYLQRVASEARILPNDHIVRVPILMYHHIRPLTANLTSKERYYSVSPASFEAQMNGLVRAGYTTITPNDLSSALNDSTFPLPEKPVLITFDDGFKDQYTKAFPIMERLGLKSTFFVISDAFQQAGALSKEMVKVMDASGLVTIGAHTQHHVFLTRVSQQKREQEIRGSKIDLEHIVGHEVTSFAYPYGAISPTIKAEVQTVGFDLGFWIQAGSQHVSSSRYQLRRIRVLDREDIVPLLDGFSHTSARPSPPPS